MQKLEKKFGGKGQADQRRSELSARRRQRGETIPSLAQDITRLVALAYEGPKSIYSDVLAIDAFLKALDDTVMARKIKELMPPDLDEAVRHALRFEAYDVEDGRSRAADGRGFQGNRGRE